MRTILASFAQEESRSVCENCKWRIRNKFKEGIPFSFSIIGYNLKNGQLEVVPHEADIVRMIFNDYLSGMGKNSIMKKLNERGIKTKKGNQWNIANVDRVLRNEKYAGDLLLQKFFSSNHIEKQKRENTGQLPRYHVKGSHEAIIDRDTFTLVQQNLEENAERFQPHREIYIEHILLRGRLYVKNVIRIIVGKSIMLVRDMKSLCGFALLITDWVKQPAHHSRYLRMF